MFISGLQKVMAEFMKENERAEMTQDMIGDTIDDALEEEGSAEEEGMIMSQVRRYWYEYAYVNDLGMYG
ncbi:hypothetical protein EON65_06555 [archaeon]|nr:MAG: hypothetical protein EON65_06555 [archaeon]